MKQMEFLVARKTDLNELLSLFRAATRQMDKQGIFQWDELYPDEGILSEDVARGNMTIGMIEGRIAVAFMLDYCEDSDYESAHWRCRETQIVVLHRLCVHPDFQGQGIAQQAMNYLENEVRSHGRKTIRLDAFSQNPAALHLYESRGYQKAGSIQYRKGLFYLYEKDLSCILL